MKRLVAALIATLAAASATELARAENAPPAFREVYEVLRTNLVGVTEAELNQASVEGLLAQFRGRASLVGAINPTNPALAKFTVIERSVVAARVGRFDSQLAGELLTNFRAATSTNKLKGLVLDLRFTAGDDYSAVAGVAELFVAKDRALLDWGNGMVKSGADSAAIEMPLAVLVNQETIGAPEALAGVLRECGVALILGNPTAGRALAGHEYQLTSGQRLRVATTPVKLGDGSEMPETGLKPDIAVTVSLEQEKSLVTEPIGPAVSAVTSTNAPASHPARSRRPTEADLVRERRETTNQLEVAPTRVVQPDKPVILDPVLARAVDLLKGLAVIRGNRSERIQD